jgi:hypothetical protein
MKCSIKMQGNDSNEYDKYDLNVKNCLYTSSLYQYKEDEGIVKSGTIIMNNLIFRAII